MSSADRLRARILDLLGRNGTNPLDVELAERLRVFMFDYFRAPGQVLGIKDAARRLGLNSSNALNMQIQRHRRLHPDVPWYPIDVPGQKVIFSDDLDVYQEWLQANGYRSRDDALEQEAS